MLDLTRLLFHEDRCAQAKEAWTATWARIAERIRNRMVEELGTIEREFERILRRRDPHVGESGLLLRADGGVERLFYLAPFAEIECPSGTRGTDVITNTKKKLSTWREAGLISQEIEERIIAYEASSEGTNWVGFGLAGVGIVALLTGLISVIAANWDWLPDSVKLGGYFAVQSVLGLLFLQTSQRPGMWREVTLAVFALFFWGGISLFGQVYNLSGSWSDASQLWLILSFPALVSGSRFLPLVWCLTSIGTAWLWGDQREFLNGAVWLTLTFPLACRGAVPLLAGTWCVVLLNLAWSWQSLDVLRNFFIDLSNFFIDPTPFFMIAAFFLVKGRQYVSERFHTALLVWGFGAILAVAVPDTDLAFSNFPHIHTTLYEMSPLRLTIFWSAAILAAVCALQQRSAPRIQRLNAAALIFCSAIFISLPLAITPDVQTPEDLIGVLGAGGFLLVWLLAAAAAGMARHRALYNVATFVIAVRFIIVYFQAFGDLATTGIGLIVSGVAIISIGLAWNRIRRSLFSALQGES